MKMKAACLFAGLFLACSTASFAQSNGTQEEQDACRPDVDRLCSQFMPDVDKIKACLDQQYCQLTPACQKVIHKYVPKLTCKRKRK